MKLLIGIFVILVLVSCGESGEQSKSITSSTHPSLIVDLRKYGNTVAAATDGTVRFVSANQTTKSPMKGYKLKFKTDNDALMSVAGAARGNAAYLSNVGRTRLWSAKFCTRELKAIMTRYKIDIVTGDLTDLKGVTQSMAVC